MSTCIIVPLYNEAKRIEEVSLIEKLSEFEYNYILVDDGSSDDTYDVLKDKILDNNKFEILQLNKNLGKAGAVRAGVQTSLFKNYSIVGFLDGDLATPIDELDRIVNIMKSREDIDLVIGSRKKIRDSVIKRKLTRVISSFCLSLLISFILGKRFYDTQCGAKVFRMETAKRIFKDPFISKWIFDIELLIRERLMNPNFESSVIEIPLMKWTHIKGSKLKGEDFLKVPFEIIKIIKFYYF